MKKVTVEKFIAGVGSIYEEMPSYEEGHDGSDGKCDCIGMVRGALLRAGATDVKNLRGTNQAARKAINDLRKLTSVAGLRVGSVVLKTRDADNPSMPLPDRYRKGGSDYDPDVGETNFTHIGTVTGLDPLVITHMTTPKPQKDKSLKGWSYAGELPWVNYDDQPEPEPPKPEPPKPTTAVVFAHTGSTVNMRRSPNIGAALVERVPVGETVEVLQYGDEWCHIKWKWFKGYMMTRFLIFDGDVPPIKYTVTIPGLSKEYAERILMDFPNGTMTAG